MRQHKCGWCKSLGRDTNLIKRSDGRGWVCPFQGCFYDDKNLYFESDKIDNQTLERDKAKQCHNCGREYPEPTGKDVCPHCGY